MRARDRLSILVAPMVFSLACVLGHVPAPTSPPPPREERVPPRPPACQAPAARCEFWPGYWHYDGASYVWVPGRWEPRSGLDIVSDSGP